MIFTTSRQRRTNLRSCGMLGSPLLAAIAAGVLAVLAACGSTLPRNPSAEAARSSEFGLEQGEDDNVAPLEGVPVDDVAVEDGGTPSESTPSTGGGPSPEGTPSTGGDTEPAAASPTTPAAPSGGRIPAGAGARGVDDETIKIGLWYYDTAATNSALSAATGNPNATIDGDYRAGAQAVVDAINARGGIAGRKVVPVYHRVDIANLFTASGQAEEEQRACAAFTQDDQVFAMMQMTGGGLMGCGVQTGTLVLANYSMALDNSLYTRYWRAYLSGDAPLADQRDEALVEMLGEQRWFTDGANTRVGVLVDDWPGGRGGAANGLLPALARQGISGDCTRKPTGGCVLQINYPFFTNAPWTNYAFQLRSANVTHVMFGMSRGFTWNPMFMMRAAEDQRYRPKWAIASDEGPSALVLFGTPITQLRNTSGVGWAAPIDIGAGLSGLPEPQSENAAWCQEIGDDSGQGIGGVGPYCEPLMLVKHVMDRAPEVSLGGMDSALANVGRTYSSVITTAGRSSLAPGRHNGGHSFQTFAFKEGCSSSSPCFQYTSEPQERL